MKKFLEVHEFELITCNEEYKDNSTYRYLEKKLFLELENLILTYQSTSDVDAIDFFNISSKRNVGKVITVKNYVGLIQINNYFQIQVLPKISFSSEDETKKIFIKMLRCLKDFPSKIFNDTNLRIDKMNIYEIFINMYIQEVRNLVKKGIKSNYLTLESNSNFYKGKLLVNEHIKRNLMHKELFYVSYDEYEKNRPENKLIKSTLLKLIQLSSNAANIKEIRQLLINFETIEPSINYTSDFAKILIDRNTKDYLMLMKWSKVFLLNQSFTTFTGDTNSKALLFPMEKVFESYVAQNLKRVMSELNWDISLQDKGYYLFDEPRKFALRPDIVITRDDESVVILDTKWKSLNNNSKLNYGISQADMYQMYAYAKKYQASEIWLLYPVNEEIKDLKINFKSDDDVIINLFFVDVKNINESITKLKNRLVNIELYQDAI